MPRHAATPVGLSLAHTAKVTSRAFGDALEAAGGSLPAWLVLRSLKAERLRNQRELADALGIRGATLTHHLNAMEADGLITRRRDPSNRRIHLVELTAKGESQFRVMRSAAVAYDQRLRAGFADGELGTLEALLRRLRHNVAARDPRSRTDDSSR
jgi:MarR family transcriptional regulator for hemolysin